MDSRDDMLQALASLEDLERFFAEFDGGVRQGVFDGVEFALARRDAPGSIPGAVAVALLVSLPIGAAAALGRRTGLLYATVTLPQPVAADLLLRSQARPPQSEESIDACFHVEVSDPRGLQDYLAAGLGGVLLRLNRQYLIEMTDERILIGPLEEVRDSARALFDLMGALPRPEAGGSSPPDFDEAVDRDGDVVEVAALTGDVNATLAIGALESEGIPCRALGLGQAGPFAQIGIDAFVRIVVPKSYAARAAEVMREFEASAESGGEDEDDDDEDEEEEDKEDGERKVDEDDDEDEGGGEPPRS
jgi:hypothetical protein